MWNEMQRASTNSLTAKIIIIIQRRKKKTHTKQHNTTQHSTARHSYRVSGTNGRWMPNKCKCKDDDAVVRYGVCECARMKRPGPVLKRSRSEKLKQKKNITHNTTYARVPFRNEMEALTMMASPSERWTTPSDRARPPMSSHLRLHFFWCILNKFKWFFSF